jgi:gas vesicle protein
LTLSRPKILKILIKNQSNNHKELIDNFVEKIVNREQELENQTVKTDCV